MTWKIRQKYRARFAGEQHLDRRQQGGSLTVCLVYPNRYRIAMSSLGFQAVYRLLNDHPGISCERAFLPERDELDEYRQSGTPLLSLESQRPLADFDVIAFSISFEPDYPALLQLLDLARIPRRSAGRNAGAPLVMAGGAACTINPEPVAEFLDLICIGEAEGVLPPLLDLLLTAGAVRRNELLARAAALPGIYVPALQPACCDDHHHECPAPVQRASASLDGSQRPASSRILTEETEFSDMYLMEVSRGCPRGCRFCTSGFTFGRFRQIPYETLVAEVDEGLRHRSKIGLVGAAVSDHHDIGRLCSYIVSQGGAVSVSSLRLDRLDSAMLDALVASGHRTISLAPEGPSQRLRDLIHKNLNRQQILDACDLLVSRDILNLKLYFIIGLPTETGDDLEEMVGLIEEIRERVVERARANRRLGEITLSVNPFIPKPFTPLQWCGMESLSSLEGKVRYLESAFRKLANVNLKVEGLRAAYFQALLSRGDRRLSAVIEAMASGASLSRALKTCGIDAARSVHRTIGLDEVLPWSVIESADDELLRREYHNVFKTGGTGQ